MLQIYGFHIFITNLIFMAAGIVLLITAAFQMLRAFIARSWPTTSAKILKAEVQRRGRRRNPSYRPNIEYQYQVENESYTANNLFYGNWPASWRQKEAQQKVKDYPVGASIEIHYNSRKPSDAVIEAQSGIAWMIALGGLIFLIGGLLLH